jgi:hypothetical protein
MKRYESVHGDKFKASQPEDYQLLAKPDDDTEKKALA